MLYSTRHCPVLFWLFVSMRCQQNCVCVVSVSVKYNLLLVGGPNENSFSQRYVDRTPLVQTPGNYSQLISRPPRTVVPDELVLLQMFS